MATETNPSGWDKERQFKDELRAANERESALRAELESLKHEKSKLDPDSTTFEDTVQRINEMQEQLRIQTDKTKKLESDLDQQRKENAKLREQAIASEGKKLIDKMLDELDAQYGAEFRNEAYARAEAAFANSPASRKDSNGEFVWDPESRRDWIQTRLAKEYQTLSREKSREKSSRSGSERTEPLSAHSATGAGYEAVEVPEGDLSSVRAGLEKKYRAAALQR